ncbi:hypothetical protein ARMSODRAFT_1010482 [Armillaria solidipes]|uniref:Uncharacterized protein n=1 Tax=Armillaria solidipes TaxID=1076256 RepID=A0A2H3C444_9AGAR|nr:hypothetical protein ARMSODRAFT_1010482 [Armillaria solidipes]
MSNQYVHVAENFTVGIPQLKPLPPPSLLVVPPSLFSLASMSSAIKYYCSVTLKLYEATLTPSELTIEEYEVLVNEQACTKEKYAEAMDAHEEWKVAKVEALRQATEKKEEWLVEAKQLADEKELQRLAMVKQQEEATERKKQNDLKKKKEEKKL